MNNKRVRPSRAKSRANLSKRNTSGYIGVTLWSDGKFVAQYKGKKVGRYKTAVEAAKAYDAKKIEVEEENAKNLNFPS